MRGKVIEMNKTDAFVSFEDGTTMNISVSSLPRNTAIGQEVNIPFAHEASMQSFVNKDRMVNNSPVDFF